MFSFDNLFANLAISLVLVLMSGLFSGLTLGLMSLDKVGLQILAEAGDPKEREYARAIAPIRAHGNLLLCSLLIGNTVVNSLLAIFLADLTNGGAGLLASTALIVIFGEIMPQAVCSRHGLFIGAKTIWLTKILILVLFAVAFPISYVLDKVLGKEIGTVYSKEELKRLIAIHVENPEAQLQSGMTQDESHILAGVLEYKDKSVREVMTTSEKIFLLDAECKLNFENMLDIYRSGFTRIPVFEGGRNNIIGVLYTKDLILIDPDDEIEARAVLAFHGLNHARFIPDSTLLHDVLNIFKTSYTHLMVATKEKEDGSEGVEVTGVITLEDVIEEVLNTEIVDETDNYISNDQRHRIKRDRNRPQVTEFLKLFDHKLRHTTTLSPEEVVAVTAYLKATIPEFQTVGDNVLKHFVRKAEVIDIEDRVDESDSPTAEVGEWDKDRIMLYKRGEGSSVFSLILQGRVLVRAGTEEFPSEMGPWGMLGVKTLTDDDYVPDFTAVTTGTCRILKFSKEDYRTIAKWSQVGPTISSRLMKSAMSRPGEIGTFEIEFSSEPVSDDQKASPTPQSRADSV